MILPSIRLPHQALLSLGTWLLSLAVVAILFTGSAHAQDGGQDTVAARGFVTELANETLSLLAQDIPDEEKQAQFAALLEAGVNTDYVSRFVLGRSWRTASADQRREFTTLFKSFLLSSLTKRLSGQYKNRSFVVKSTLAQGKRDVLVRSEIQRQSGPATSIEWRVREFDGNWQIIDIKAEGLSLAITQREEYGAVVQRKGMDGLIAALRKQVEPQQEEITEHAGDTVQSGS